VCSATIAKIELGDKKHVAGIHIDYAPKVLMSQNFRGALMSNIKKFIYAVRQVSEPFRLDDAFRLYDA
jgi:hypothetical protein